MKRKYVILIVLAVIVAIMAIGISIYFYYDNLSLDGNNLYEVTYYDDGIPGSKSVITVYENQVDLTTTHFCSAVDCNNSTKKETFTYSKENQAKLKSFMASNFHGRNIELHQNNLSDYQQEVLTGMTLGEYFFEVSVEKYQYKLEYSESDNLSYIVYLKENDTILVKKLTINNDYSITNVTTYPLNFSKDNLKVIVDYIKKESSNEEGHVIYKNPTLKKDEVNIIKSITDNDETYLNGVEDTPKLAYTITYSGINCLTPTLYLYDDNTYEYYYTFTSDDEKLIPKSGIYNYDISKIIKDSNDDLDDFAWYNITDNKTNKDYTISVHNKELSELLGSINVKLGQCLIQQ